MNWVAWKMLTGDRSKYFGIIFGVAFGTTLMTQQASMFCGIMRNTTAPIQNVAGPDIWVMAPETSYVDDAKPIAENDLYRVRGVEGVAWAVPLYKGITRAQLSNGNFQQVIVLGLDDATLVGAPTEFLPGLGSLADLRQPDAFIIDDFGYQYLWPGEPFQLGKRIELNDRRAYLVGICKAAPTFLTFPVLYTRYSWAMTVAPRERRTLSFILAQPREGVSAHEVCRRIQDRTGLQALSRVEFMWGTIGHYLTRTGIPINFGLTVLLGFIVGCAIAGQTFYLFTVENLKQFAVLKAMGLSNLRIVAMILLQALVVSVIGYAIGVGGASGIEEGLGVAVKAIPPAFFMSWHILTGVGVAVMLIGLVSSLLSMRRVLVLEPGIVFR
jgi:putative ABC transport system permease protein